MTERNEETQVTEEPQDDQAPSAPEPPEEDDAIGGEIRVTGGGMPIILRRIAYALFVWAVLYLVVHPRVEHMEIVWATAGALTAWLLFFALTKRPADP